MILTDPQIVGQGVIRPVKLPLHTLLMLLLPSVHCGLHCRGQCPETESIKSYRSGSSSLCWRQRNQQATQEKIRLAQSLTHHGLSHGCDIPWYLVKHASCKYACTETFLLLYSGSYQSCLILLGLPCLVLHEAIAQQGLHLLHQDFQCKLPMHSLHAISCKLHNGRRTHTCWSPILLRLAAC